MQNSKEAYRKTTQFKKSVIVLGLLSCLGWSQAISAESDLLSAHSVLRGKSLKLEIIKELLGEAVDTAFSYYFDYSNAGFQVEDHYWSEGLGVRYRNLITQTFRSIDFISLSRRTYQTQKIEIKNDGNEIRYSISCATFNDWEETSRHLKTYRTGLERGRIEEWPHFSIQSAHLKFVG